MASPFKAPLALKSNRFTRKARVLNSVFFYCIYVPENDIGFPVFEVCNPDQINTTVNTVEPGEDRRENSQKARYVMENMSAPLACSCKSNELYNIKSPMHAEKGYFYLHVMHQLSIFSQHITSSINCQFLSFNYSHYHIEYQLPILLCFTQTMHDHNGRNNQ